MEDCGSCGVCQVKASRKCTRCWEAVYCSEEHQRQDWGEHKKGCSPPMILQTDPEMGQYWVASRDLRSGTLLVKELPALKLTAWPDGTEDFYKCTETATCLGCGFHIEKPCLNYRCSSCGWPVCDADCEKAPVHAENECGIFKEKKFEFPPPRAGLISPRRIDWAVSAIRTIRLKASKPRLYRELMNLQHEPSLRMPKAFEDTLRLAVSVLNLHLGICNMGMEEEEIVKSFWIVKLNSLNCAELVKEGEETERGRTDCVYTKWSKFNNSCAPNCAYSTKPKAPEYPMMVRTTVAVKAGEPLTISYIRDLSCSSFEDRQGAFMKRFFFACKCKRCVDPTELGTYSSAIACGSCYAERKDGVELDPNLGYLLPEDPLKALMEGDSYVWKCNRCNKHTTASSFLPTVEKLGRLVRKPIKSLEMVEKLKKEYSGKVLHPNHWILQEASHGVIRLWESNKERGTKEFPFETFKTHLLYRLATENVLSPGISLHRAHLQRRFVMAAQITQQLERNDKTWEEKANLLKTCYQFIQEAHLFFENFKDGVPQGPVYYFLTSMMKEDLEKLIGELGLAVDANQ